jgi:ATP-dependent Clp protease ATP-binding subunit ClpB
MFHSRSLFSANVVICAAPRNLIASLVWRFCNTISGTTGGFDSMNLEKFTDRAKGFLQAAQTVAIRMNHQRITPEHLLKALLEDSEGMAAGLIQRAGGDAPLAVGEVDKALAKVAAVSGGGAQATPGLDNDAVRILDQAEQIAAKSGDSFVTVERLLVALALASTTAAGQALKAAGATPQALEAAITA